VVTVSIAMHLNREPPIVEPGHERRRTMSQPVQQRSDLPMVEHTAFVALPVAGKDVERTRVTCRYKLQYPHFGRTKPRGVHREFFQELQHDPPKLRQHAEIRVQQIEPMLRRRPSIGLPRHAGGFEMIV